MNTRRITFCGLIAAVYAALTVAMAAWSFGPIQLRVSELLCLLCYFNPCAVWGVTAGCFLANLFSTVSPLDLLFGTAATLIGCSVSARIRSPWLFPLPIILSNALLVGIELSLTLASEGGFFAGLLLFGGQVLAGEAAVLYLAGVPLLFLLNRTALKERLSEY